LIRMNIHTSVNGAQIDMYGRYGKIYQFSNSKAASVKLEC